MFLKSTWSKNIHKPIKFYLLDWKSWFLFIRNNLKNFKENFWFKKGIYVNSVSNYRFMCQQRTWKKEIFISYGIKVYLIFILLT